MKLALLVKWHREDLNLFLRFHSWGLIPTRHHLFRWEREVHKKTNSLFVKRWVPSEYNSFDHFPKYNICITQGSEESKHMFPSRTYTPVCYFSVRYEWDWNRKSNYVTMPSTQMFLICELPSINVTFVNLNGSEGSKHMFWSRTYMPICYVRGSIFLFLGVLRTRVCHYFIQKIKGSSIFKKETCHKYETWQQHSFCAFSDDFFKMTALSFSTCWFIVVNWKVSKK